MRFHGIALLTSAAILGACGGEKQPATDSSATATATGTSAPVATPTPATDAAAATAATPGATTGTAPAAGAAGAAGAAAPATGTTHTVQMVGDATGYKFVPADITVKTGDAIKFVMVSGAPHNVSFPSVPPAVQAQLDANMPGAKLGPANGPMIMQPNEAYVVSFGKVPAGKYEYVCVPHLAMNMKGTVTVQ
jgi:plastocyanin